MGILTAPASAADLDLLSWTDVISAAHVKTCDEYTMGFYRIANDAEANKQPCKSAVARMLVYLSTLRIHSDDLRNPLRSSDSVLQVERLDQKDIEFLRAIEPLVADNDLLSRIRDLLWIVCRDGRAGIAAIDPYVASATALMNDNSFNAVDRLERGLRLSLSLGQKQQQRRIVELAKSFVWREQTSLNFTVARFVQLLLLVPDPEYNVQTAERLLVLAQDAKLLPNRLLQRHLLELSSEFYRNAGDLARQRSTMLQHAESYVEEAEQLGTQPNIYFGQPAHLVECAIHALRKLPDTRQRVDELRPKLEFYQSKIVGQMVPLSETIRVDAIVEAARDHVTRPTIHEAIFALAMITRPKKVADLIRQVHQHNDQYIARFLFASRVVNAAGRTVAVERPMEEGDDENSPAFRVEMNRLAALGRDVAVQGLIEPARFRICDQFRVRYEDVASFVWNNPVVPYGREHIVVQGLRAGFDGDYLTATHILIPQIENMVRALLASAGHLTSSLASDGVQDEHSLNTTLRNASLPSILGDDLVFDLCGLLIERYGSNLRNEVAHGLRDFGQLCVPDTAYCWWLALHMLCSIKLRATAQTSLESA